MDSSVLAIDFRVRFAYIGPSGDHLPAAKGATRMTYLGMTARTATAVAVLALASGAIIGAAIPTRCAVVEHGLTGPEASVTIGRTVEACSDGTTRVTEWIAGDDGLPLLTSAEYADVLSRMDAIRDARTGGRFDEGSDQ
jgi:hypothetical protein